MKDQLDASDYEKELEDQEPWDRLCNLHMTLRNIPRKYLEEYMSVPEDRMKQIFNNDGEGDIA